MIRVGKAEMRFGKKIVRQSHSRKKDDHKASNQQGVNDNFVFTNQKCSKRNGKQHKQVKITAAV
jgi:hypothetical protein